MTTGFDYRSVSWLAERLGVKEDEAIRLLQGGRIPGLQLGDKWFVSESGMGAFFSAETNRQTAGRRLKSGSVALSPSAGKRTRQTGSITYSLFGREGSVANWRELVLVVLRELAFRDKTFLPRFSSAGGRKRRYVAQDPSDLYPDRPDLADTARDEIEQGWWVGTNYSIKEKTAILEKACEVAGIRLGIDLIIGSGSPKASLKKAMAFVRKGRDTDPSASIRHDELFVEAIQNKSG
jgi:hypothetical protein